MTSTLPYGTDSASYDAAGGREGISVLVDAFYRIMNELAEATTIRAMHPSDLEMSRLRLKVFLCGWLGGPNLYAKTFGSISIPRFHAHFVIDEPERDAWLRCMQLAVDEQPWAATFKDYFMRVIAVPAERVRLASTAARQQAG